MHSGPAPGGTLTPPSFHFFIWINKIKGQIQAFYKEIGKLRHSLSTVLLNDIFISVIIDTSKENFDPDKEESEGQSVSPHGALRPFFFFNYPRARRPLEGSRQRLEWVRNLLLCP